MAEDPTEQGAEAAGQELHQNPDPSLAEPYIEAAGRALSDSDWKGAEEAFAQGLTIAPRDPRLHGGLALIAIQEQDWERAIAHGRQAVALGAGGAEVHNNLGWALEQSGRGDQALAAYSTAFRSDPSRPEPIHHLLRLGLVPGSEDEPAASVVELETLLRLDLYRSLATQLHEGACDHTWTWTYQWAEARGAPWGPIVAWLMHQGVQCDCSVLSNLTRLDEHLADSALSGMILGDAAIMDAVLGAGPDIKLLDLEAAINDEDRLPGQGHLLLAQRTTDGGRVQLPSQRCHAAVIYQLLGDLLPMLGPEAAVVLTIDPIKHLGPRRVWMLGGLTEAEVEGTWALFDSDGEQVGDDMRLSPTPLPAEQIPLHVPGVDRASLEAVISEAGLDGPVRVDPDGGRLWFHADHISSAEDRWLSLLARLARWLPEGERSFASWRKGAAYQLAVLQRGETLQRLELQPSCF